MVGELEELGWLDKVSAFSLLVGQLFVCFTR